MADKLTISFRLNGRQEEAEIYPHENLVEVLRKNFQLYGARESCGQGLCGACTVIVNGRAVSGCLALGYTADGAEVLTVEGLGTPENLHPIQESFAVCSGFQCGFCTPGMVLMTERLLTENPKPTTEEIKHYLSGNICRCAAYPEIIESVKQAAEEVEIKIGMIGRVGFGSIEGVQRPDPVLLEALRGAAAADVTDALGRTGVMDGASEGAVCGVSE